MIRGLVCATAMLPGAPRALAQDAPVATPTPLPSRTPSIITLPGVVPERYSLPGTTVPVQAPPPVTTPSPAPAPSSHAGPPRVEASRVGRQPERIQRRVEAPTPTPVSIATATPARVENAIPPPLSIAAPAPASAVEQPAMPGWLWMLIGAGVTALLSGAVWLVVRRRSDMAEQEMHTVEVAAPTPRAVAPPAPPPAPAPVLVAATPARPRSDPFEIGVRPGRIELGARDVTLDFELLIVNRQAEPADAVRLSLAMMSASPDQDRILAGFHRGPPGEAAGEAFDLVPGGGIRMPVRLMLPRDGIHVVRIRDRPMFVAMALIDLRWRSNLSIRRFGVDFMIGTAGQGDKVGPIWLDRGQPGMLSAIRYVPREAAAA